MNVNNNSDFTMKMYLVDNEGNVFNPSSYNFKLDFYTAAKHYFATKKGDTLKNCVINSDKSIDVYFDNPRFQVGTLKCVFTYYVADSNYKDGYRAVTSILAVGVEVVEGNGDTYVEYQAQVVEKSVILTDASSVTVNGVSIIPDRGRVMFDGDLSTLIFYGNVTFSVFDCTYATGVTISIGRTNSFCDWAIKDLLNTIGTVRSGSINIKEADVPYMEYDDYLVAIGKGWTVPKMTGSVYIEADKPVKINGADRTPVNNVIYMWDTEVSDISTTDANMETGEFTYSYEGKFLRIRQAYCSATFSDLSKIMFFAANGNNIDISGLQTTHDNRITGDFMAMYGVGMTTGYVNSIDESIRRHITSLIAAFSATPITNMILADIGNAIKDGDLVMDNFPLLTNGSGMFNGCSGLQNVTLDLPALTDGSGMFNGCRGLQTVTLDLPALTDGSSMLQGCSGLQSVTLDLPALTSGSSMLQGCIGLQTVTLDLPALTDGSSMLQGCSGLQTVTLDLPALTDGSYMFNGCIGLQTVTLDLPALTSGSGMLQNCSGLQNVTLDLPALTSGESMLYGCSGLQTVTLDLPALTDGSITNIFDYSLSSTLQYMKIAVQSYNNTSIITISSPVLTYLNLGAGAGKVNFNLTISSTVLVSQEAVTDLANSLGTVSGKTLTLSAETKAALTTYNLLSAITEKGWTVA